LAVTTYKKIDVQAADTNTIQFNISIFLYIEASLLMTIG